MNKQRLKWERTTKSHTERENHSKGKREKKGIKERETQGKRALYIE